MNHSCPQGPLRGGIIFALLLTAAAAPAQTTAPAPAQQAPAQQAPAQQAPPQQAPAQQTPAQQTPAQQTPAQQAPAQQAPAPAPATVPATPVTPAAPAAPAVVPAQTRLAAGRIQAAMAAIPATGATAAEAPNADPAAPPAPGGEAPKEAPPTPDLGAALKTMKFDRSSDALLAATRAQRRDTPLTPQEAFNVLVVLGDWQGVGKALATVPPESAVAGYTRLLEALAEQSLSSGAVWKRPGDASEEEDPNARRMRLQKEKEDLKKKAPPLLSKDFYELVEASPGDLREENVPALTQLVKMAVGEGGRATLVERLQKGWKGIGGSTPDGRKLAVRLLSSLGWIKDAAPFLPLDPAAWDAADTTELVFAMEYFTQTGIADRDERQFQKAALIAARLMKSGRFGNYTRPQFRLAMDRLVQLLPLLEPAQARTLVSEQLLGQTATLSDLIGSIGELGQTAARGSDLQARVSSLGTQRLILEALSAKKDELPANVAVLVMNWLTEAEACYRAGGAMSMEKTQAEKLILRRYGMYNQGGEEAPNLSAAQILESAPPRELVARLNPGLVQRVALTLVKVGILRPEQPDLTLLREYAKQYPGLEQEVCQDVLAGWVSARTKPAENDTVKQMRMYGMYIPPQLQQQGSGIPLTRARQKQNIEQFRDLLARLREISPQPLDPALIVQSFMTLHSGAEVYRMEDIQAIFGPPEKMVQTELLDLLSGMRGRLNEEWRNMETQQQAGTNRTEEEAKDEVSRGYRTALELAKRGIRAEDATWEAFITRGQLFYDASQYELERQVKLTDYVSLRDEAFGSFATAAKIYAAKLADLPQGQWTIAPYQQWFYVMLGASDVGRLSSSASRTDPGLKSIGDLMRALPGGAGEKHIELFGKMLGEIFPRVPANMRQRFLGAGLAIVGENNPAAASATKSLDYYHELLDEIQLRVSIDGPGRVGHSEPFGAFLSLETSRQLLRESGGFAKYLQNRPSGMGAMMGMGGGAGEARDLRDDFAKNIHAALDGQFEVLSVTWHDAAVKTIDLPRDGWVETPLAYVVLRARDAAVDRIPSIQMDMDFLDQPGQVVLPVMSQVEPLDARDGEVANRPCPDLALSLVMDDREWKDGRVVVEIQARGKGVIPDLDQLFDTKRDGFDLETVDGKLLVSQFTSDGKQRLPQADRNWSLTYRRKADLRGDVVFPFPAQKPGVSAASTEYRRYQDADLVTIDPAQAAAGVKLAGSTGSWLRNLILGLGVLVAIAIAVVFFRKKPALAAVSGDDLAVPSNPTPFSALAFLHRLRRSHGQLLSADEKAELEKDIGQIGASHFKAGKSEGSGLTEILARWSKMANVRQQQP